MSTTEFVCVTVLAVVGVICLTYLVAQVVGLRHSAAMRLSTDEIAVYSRAAQALRAELLGLYAQHEKQLVEHQDRLVAIDNRTRR